MKKIFSLVIALTAVACGSDPASDVLEHEIKTVTVDEGTFKLYDNANVAPEAFCDLHVLLSMKNTQNGSVAIFENALEGVCEIAVSPNPRTYVLTELESTCGSRVFTGKIQKAVKGAASSILITDHRNRICKDIVPATVIVEKISIETPIQTLFSVENRVSTLIALEGTLTRMMAIGGESTGYGLQLTDGNLIEIELEGDLIRDFVEDQKVSVAGKYKTVRGIAIPARQVFVIKSMTAI
jgi:hypothetical protein